MEPKTPYYIHWFKDLSIEDVPLVGGKNASLGEMYQSLTAQGIAVPNGFAVSASAYRDMLEEAGAWSKLEAILDGLNKDDVADLAKRAAQARDVVFSAPLSTRLKEDILGAYSALKDEYGDNLSLAVRSSATAEDLPNASFAGQHDTYLNITGGEHLLNACKRCFASLFTDRAIAYRINQGFDHLKVALSVTVMKMVRSDISSSGVMFSLDTESGFRDVVFITGAYGLGENVVQGAVDPDEFYVHKPTFENSHRAVLRRTLGNKQIKMVYGHTRGGQSTQNIPVPQSSRDQYCLSDDEVLQLAEAAIKIEKHYSDKAGKSVPMDMEWAKDGIDGKLYIVQARPETVASQRSSSILEEYRIEEPGALIIQGRAVGERIASGKVRIIEDASDLTNFQAGEVLVADITTPDWGPVLKTASAIVTNRGGRNCHAAIVARELGIPAIVGTETATTTLNTGSMVTISCADGDTGHVYEGKAKFSVEKTDLSGIATPATEVMAILANPDIAFKTAMLPNDGVGLLRMEFIINEHIGVHPMALVHPEKIEDKTVSDKIAQLCRGYDSYQEFFIQKLAEGVGTIAAAFYPKPVIVRLSDFKTNEYASLLGGQWFEMEEANPMLGFRGAARYTHPNYSEGFALECLAMKRVREDMGLSNVKLMIPFCRRVDEGKKVLQEMKKHGLERGKDSLEVYVMCEIPNNVMQLDRFAEHFDGFSIGSNDLTQLTLGVDRDSEIVAFDFDERDDGVREMIRLAVEGSKRNNRHSGLCGQAPSDYPEITEFLVKLGIDSISLNPDVLLKTTRQILDVEAQLGIPPRKQ